MTNVSNTLQPSTESDEYFNEWTHSSEILFYAVIYVSFLSLALLPASLVFLQCFRRNSPFFPYLCAILTGNFILLGTLLCSVLAKNFNDWVPGFVMCKLSTFLVNSSSCFVNWTWVAMYAERFFSIYFPFQRRKVSIHPHRILVVVAVFSMAAQSWTFFFITERSLGNEQVNIFCGANPEDARFSKLIVLIDSFTSFFIPFLLTLGADIAVLRGNSCRNTFQLVTQQEIGRRSIGSVSSRKIVSRLSVERTAKRRSFAIRKCLISASISLFLNLPNYTLQLVDEFLALRNTSWLFLKIDAFVYILYLIQFPLATVHIVFLTKRRRTKQTKLESNGLLQK